MKLNLKIASDKMKHMVAGAVIALLVMGAGYYFGCPYYGAAGIITAIFAGWAKEYLYDARHPETQTVDDMDWAATFVGGALAVGGWKLCYAFIAAMLASYGIVINLDMS